MANMTPLEKALRGAAATFVFDLENEFSPNHKLLETLSPAAIYNRVTGQESLTILLPGPPESAEFFTLTPAFPSMSEQDCLRMLEEIALHGPFVPKAEASVAEELDTLWVVSGRLYGEDDDTVHLVRARSSGAASQRFWDYIHDCADIDEEDRRHCDTCDGDPTGYIISCESFRDAMDEALTADDMDGPAPTNAPTHDDDGLSP